MFLNVIFQPKYTFSLWHQTNFIVDSFQNLGGELEFDKYRALGGFILLFNMHFEFQRPISFHVAALDVTLGF